MYRASCSSSQLAGVVSRAVFSPCCCVCVKPFTHASKTGWLPCKNKNTELLTCWLAHLFSEDCKSFAFQRSDLFLDLCSFVPFRHHLVQYICVHLVKTYLNLLCYDHHPFVDVVGVGYGVDRKCLSENGDYPEEYKMKMLKTYHVSLLWWLLLYLPGNVGVVWPEDERMVCLDQITQVAVDKGRLVDVLHNRQPTEPKNWKSDKKMLKIFAQSHHQVRNFLRFFSKAKGATTIGKLFRSSMKQNCGFDNLSPHPFRNNGPNYPKWVPWDQILGLKIFLISWK